MKALVIEELGMAIIALETGDENREIHFEMCEDFPCLILLGTLFCIG
jgi:hypothetical protein